MGALAVVFVWGLICLFGGFRPWIAVAGYSFFAVLCPQWNWRWSIPDLDFQKFIAASALGGFLLSGLKSNRLRRGEILPIAALLIYLALSYVSSFNSISPVKTSIFLDISWKIVLMTVMTAAVIKQPVQIKWLFVALIVAQGWNSWNVNQIYLNRGFINVNSFSWNFLDNNTYSISTVPVMAMALAVILTTQTRWVRLLCGFVFVLQIHQIMLLESRGTMIGVIVTCGLAMYWMPKNRTTYMITLSALVVGAVLAGPPVVKEFSSSFASADDLDGSAESRYKVWRAGAEIIADYPILGVGPWAGERYVPDYYPGGLDQPAKALHNLFFEIGTGSGVPALVCYLAFFWLPWWRHYRLGSKLGAAPDWFRTVNLAIICGVPGYWVASMFSSGALIESPYILVASGIASMAVVRDYPVDESNRWAFSNRTDEGSQLNRFNARNLDI